MENNSQLMAVVNEDNYISCGLIEMARLVTVLIMLVSPVLCYIPPN